MLGSRLVYPSAYRSNHGSAHGGPSDTSTVPLCFGRLGGGKSSGKTAKITDVDQQERTADCDSSHTSIRVETAAGRLPALLMRSLCDHLVPKGRATSLGAHNSSFDVLTSSELHDTLCRLCVAPTTN